MWGYMEVVIGLWFIDFSKRQRMWEEVEVVVGR